MKEASPTEVRRAIGEHLRARRDEIEQEILAAVGAFGNDESLDPEYALGLRVSISVALDFGIECFESSELSAPPVPTQLYAQARLAARNGVDLPTVVERYIDGYMLLQGFVDEVAEAEGMLNSASLREVRRVSSLLFKRLLTDVSEQHAQEVHSRVTFTETRRVGLVRRALDGERIDAAELSYDFDLFHVALVASGADTAAAIGELAKALDCISLTVEAPDASTWAWLGRRAAPDIDRMRELVVERWPSESFIAIGEVGKGKAGWRLTHLQAKAAFPLSLQPQDHFFRYGDDPFLVTLFHDNLLAESVRQMYLAPLSKEPDGGEKLRQTLRAYFAAERNSASTAVALNVSRHTVKNHLQTVESRLGRLLPNCMAELEASLRLEDMG